MTPERLRKLRAALARRQPDLTVLAEGVRKAYNLSAIVRTCDAVGIPVVHAVAGEGAKRWIGRKASSGSHKWVRVRWHAETAAAYQRLRDAGHRIVVAHPGEECVDFREVDYTRPTAIVLGTELQGASEYAVAAADLRIRIPMHGLVESLNVSVASAVVLYEAERQRRAAGMYDRQYEASPENERLLFEWGYPRLARELRRRGLPFPPLRDDGSAAFEAIREGGTADGGRGGRVRG